MRPFALRAIPCPSLPDPCLSFTIFTYDFGIVKLASPLTYSASVAPVCLPDPAFSSSKYVGRTDTVSGWGVTTAKGTNASTVLKDLEVNVFSNEQCVEKIHELLDDMGVVNGWNDYVLW